MRLLIHKVQKTRVIKKLESELRAFEEQKKKRKRRIEKPCLFILSVLQLKITMVIGKACKLALLDMMSMSKLQIECMMKSQKRVRNGPFDRKVSLFN